MAEHEDGDLRTAAKAAAATAAVGAAVGVARAIAARAEQASQHDDEPDERRDEPEQRDEPVSVDAHDEDDETADDERDEHEEQEPVEQEPVEGTSVDRLRRLTDRARDLLQELSGSDVESVSAIDRTRDGFRITLEAVEVRRIPESTDVLASYDVELDGDGDLVRYERRRRYARSQSDAGGGA